MQVYPFSGTLIRFRGQQCLKWLQGYVTNDVRKLSPNIWLETFATDMKGKCLSHGCIFAQGDDAYFLCPGADQASILLPFWHKYMFIADVEGFDLSNEVRWYFVRREDFSLFLESIGASLESNIDLSTGQVTWLPIHGDEERMIVMCGFALNADFILCGIPQALATKLTQTDVAEEYQTRALAAAQKFPWFGIDFNSDNLPQEVDRDQQAISFTKGCYLGQETIARLDALGQVQKKLHPVQIASQSAVPNPQNIIAGTDSDGKPLIAGTLTSAYLLQIQSLVVGWSMLKRKYFKPVTILSLESGEQVTLS